MKAIELTIKRSCGYKTYRVEIEEGSTTVLEALQTIQSECDETLAFRYGCRYRNCGLCGMKVNGNARMACMTKVRNGVVIEPLDNLPVIEDLIVDRSMITNTIRKMKLFPKRTNDPPAPMSKEFETVSKCTECQVCISGAPKFNDSPGPLFFVKLAQLYYHPHVDADYKQIAKALGIERFRNVEAIPCPYGIPIKKLAIDPFLKMMK